ncbi:MAG: MnhB domain-containing protein [Chloroflexota bacterium]|nr:MnhB domain-containing protein [Chloroflexota bacterium]
MNETPATTSPEGSTTILTQSMARVLLLPIFMVAMATMVKGYADTGDGFSAGVIASLGVLLQYVAIGAEETERSPIVHFAAAGALVGLVIALGVAFLPVLAGEAVLTHFPAPGEHVIHFGSLELITAVLFDVGVFLIVFGFGVGVIGTIARATHWSRR